MWTPRSGHVSQLRRNPDGTYSGDDDCGPACVVRYLREQSKLSVDVPVLSQLDALRWAIDNHPDEEDQAGTTAGDLEAYCARYGIQGAWSTSWQAIAASPYAIVLVTAAPRLADGTYPYPESWLGGQEHWILWLPRWQHAIDWFNDPLTYSGGERDTQLDLGYLQAIQAGAILLPDVTAAAPHAASVEHACALKVQPNHTCSALARIAAGVAVTATGQRSGDWARVRLEDGRVGWVLADNLAA